MKRTVLALAAVALLICTMSRGAAAQQSAADVAFREAMETQNVRGDLPLAIKQFQKIVGSRPNDRHLVARALLQIAECYERMGEAEARKYYKRVVDDYPEQKDAVLAARARLLRSSSPAGTSRTANRAIWTVTSGADVYGKVSPNGRYLPFTNWDQQGDLFLHDLTSGTDRRLTTAASKAEPAGDEWSEECAFSRDSRLLAFAWGKGNRYQLRVVEVDRSGVPQPRTVIDNPDIKWIAPEDWTPDGAHIVVGIQRTDGSAQIALVTAASGAITVLKSLEWRGYMRMALSPDGRRLAYDLRQPQSNARDIHLISVDGSADTPVVAQDGDDRLLGWSPTGDRLLFTSARTGVDSVWSVTFTAGRPGGPPQLLRPDVGSIDDLGMTASGELYMTKWGWTAGADLKLAKFDFRAGRFTTPPETVEPNGGLSSGDPRWSGDGRFLAYTVQRGDRRTADVAVRIRSMADGATRELRPKLSRFGFVWSPGDDALLAVGEDFTGRHGLYRIDVVTGETTPYAIPAAGERVFLPIVDRRPGAPSLYYRRLQGAESVLVEREISSGAEREVARGVQVGLSLRRQKTYARRVGPNQDGIIVERDLVTGTEREVFRHRNLTSFVGSPNRPGMLADSGRLIAVITDPATKSSAWLSAALDGSETRELIRAMPSESLSIFATNPEATVAFVKKAAAGTSPVLLRVPLDGSGPTPLEVPDVGELVGGTSFSIHPDGEQVAFIAARGAQIPYEVWVLENFLPAPKKPDQQ